MKFIELTTEEQFLNLKEGDCILVKWSDYTIKHNEGKSKINMYNIYENKLRCDEIICELENNHYFNWKMHLKGISCAEEVYSLK